MAGWPRTRELQPTGSPWHQRKRPCSPGEEGDEAAQAEGTTAAQRLEGAADTCGDLGATQGCPGALLLLLRTPKMRAAPKASPRLPLSLPSPSPFFSLISLVGR